MVHLLTLLALVLPAFIIANPVQPHGNAYYNVGNERRLIQRFANTTISSGSSTIPSTNQSSVATSSSRQTLSTVSLTSTPATNSSGSTIISITSGTSSTVLKTSSALSASSVSSSSTLSSTSSQISTASNSSTASASSSPPSSSSYISSSTASSYSSFTKSASASSTTSSPSSQSAQNSTISLTSFPTYIAPSSTTLTGAQESSESKKIAPLFLWLYSQKDSLQDSNRKQEYVDNVKKTNDEVVALLDSLDTHPDPEPECDKTALKRWALSETKLKKLIAEKRVVVRSLVSGIIDELDNAAKLLSCATKIMGNLVNAVESTDVSTDVVQNLTDSLKDIEEALEKQDDKPSSSVTESTSDTTSSASCTQSSAVASCTETISLSTIFSAAGTTTTSSIKTITTTTCDTITACSATATTVTTTISTSSTTSSSAWVCEATSCSTCTQSTSRRAEPPSNGGLYELDRRAPFLMGDLEEWKGDEDDYFTQRVRNGENVQELDWNVFDRADPLSVEAISLNREFGTADQVTWVDGITGCTVLVVVSKRGLWFAHLFEGGFVERNSVETDKWNHILQYVQNGGSRFILPSTLASNGGILSKDNDVQIYIHTPAVGTRKVNPQNKAARYADKVNQISNYLFGAGTPFEGIEVKISTYYKPEDHDPNLPDTETGAGEISRYANTARFKVMIEYSPALKYFREDDCTEPTAKARRVWFEKDPIYPVFWDIIPESTNKVKRQACSIRTTASGSATASSTSGASNSGTSTLTGSSSKLSSTTKASETTVSSVSSTQSRSTSSLVTSTKATLTASETSTPVTSTSSTTTETPTVLPPQDLHCAGSGANKFLSRVDLNNAIGKFCSDAAAQKVHDKDSGSISRIYNAGTRYEVHLSIDWPQGLDISSNMEADCNANMANIMDNCDGNDPKNPLNWKHGGTFGADAVQYAIVPWIDQGYTPGECSFHLQEDESWSGVDGPGTKRTWKYHIERATMKDGAGATIGTIGFADNGKDADPQSAGDGNPLIFKTKLPDDLEITPEARGNPRDYVQFAIGSLSWTTNTPGGGRPSCNVGGWSSNYSPANRNMDCFFTC